MSPLVIGEWIAVGFGAVVLVVLVMAIVVMAIVFIVYVLLRRR